MRMTQSTSLGEVLFFCSFSCIYQKKAVISDSALRCNSPEITFAQFSELQLNRQKPELIQALFIFFVNLFGTSNFL